MQLLQVVAVQHQDRELLSEENLAKRQQKAHQRLGFALVRPAAQRHEPVGEAVQRRELDHEPHVQGRHLAIEVGRHAPALFLDALALLAWAKLRVHLLPFRWVAPSLGRANGETAASVPAGERALAVEISWAVQAAARHVPLRFVCLPQAIAAQRMLRRRGIATTLYLGVALDKAKRETITAHAWLRAGDKIVPGETEARRHRVLATFADFASLSSS